MTTTFDIFIKGINPERAAETDEIKAQAVKVLQIELSDLEDLLAQPHGACIRRDSPESEAKQYQRTLSKLGLVCIYSPARKLSNFELIPMEDKSEDSALLICPNCEHELSPDEEGSQPEKCDECGITITKFLEQKLRNEEREAIKTKLLASQNIMQSHEAKRQQEEAEKQRKLELEKEVLQELHNTGDVKKPLNLKLLAIGGGLIALTVGSSYFFTQSSSTPPPNATASSATTGAETKSATGSAVQTPKGADAKNAAPVSSQEAMQKTHDQAAQVLQGFGLDADAFANAGSSGGEAALLTEEMLTGAAPTTNQTPTVAKNSNVPTDAHANTNAGSSGVEATATSVASTQSIQSKVAPKKTNTLPPISSQELFSVLSNDITWDRFLAKNSKTLLERQLPENAGKLSKHIVEDDVYVDALGELLRAAQLGKQSKLLDDYFAALETRLALLPTEQQAIYFAQAGSYLKLENGSNRLLARAEGLLAGLPPSASQINPILKLAVVHSKMGNIAAANNYFNKVNNLLTPIADADLQVQLRIAVARAYQEINNTAAAVQWLESTAPMVNSLKSDSLNRLITGYAQCNQWQTALNMLKQTNAKERYDFGLYQTIVASLKAGLIPNALELHKSLQIPVYKALSAIFIADYLPATANELVTNSEQLLTAQSSFAEKAIVASRLVGYYGKMKNTSKTEMLIKETQNALSNLQPSNEKDEILAIVVQQYTHGFQTKAANNLLVNIQTTSLKTRLNVEINQLADVGVLLK